MCYPPKLQVDDGSSLRNEVRRHMYIVHLHTTLIMKSPRRRPLFSPGDTWWAASDLGWIVGHEYICYSPLLNGNTTVVYEGKPVGTPDAGQFFR